MKKYQISVVLAIILLSLTNCSNEEPIQPDQINSITKIIISPGYLRAPVDSTIQFTAYGIYQNNDTLQIDTEWLSDDTTAITINSDGLATCKNVGSAYIYAKYKDISSKGRYIDVIPKRKAVTQFLIGQIQGNDIEYVDIEPDIVISMMSNPFEIDFDNDNTNDFSFRAIALGGNNLDLVFVITASGNNKVAINPQYHLIADSILYSEIDSNDTYNLPKMPHHFANWVEAFYEGDTLTNVTNWHSNNNTINYWYKRDGSSYYSPNYGLFHDGEEKYIGMLFYNQYNYPIYCWFKIQFDATYTHYLHLKEYAYAPKY